jgi:hypothetical protein
MWHQLRSYVQRGRRLAQSGELADAIRVRFRSWHQTLQFNAGQIIEKQYKEYSADLPAGLAARKITLRLSVPKLPLRPVFAFADHVVDEAGKMTDTVLAVTAGGFAISRDRGKTWKRITVKQYSGCRFAQIISLGDGEFLANVVPAGSEGSKTALLDLLVLNERGDVLVRHAAQGHRWHGCRGIHSSNGTLMYAEYPSNMLVKRRRPSACRVFRSRDRGRTWKVVFEQTGLQIRHFHFLQTRPNFAGEWWLTSGDFPHESRIWVTRDDGDSWASVTASLPERVQIDGTAFDHSMFRSTDLVWMDDHIVWGTDDPLLEADPPGARVFRSKADMTLAPELVGVGKWHFRNAVDIGDFILFLAQRSNQPNPSPEDNRPSVYLMPKKPVPGIPSLLFLFSLDAYPSRRSPGFTFSKASRAAIDGTFFSFRSSEDVFPAGHRILEWNVRLT